MKLPLFLLPTSARTVTLCRLRAGKIISFSGLIRKGEDERLAIPSRGADVVAAVQAAFRAGAPPHELRLFGTARGFEQAGARPTRDVRGDFWTLSVPLDTLPARSLYLPCYLGAPEDFGT